MSKDPAVLFYIGEWLTSTAEMDADTRGWYLNLLLHNYDKGDLPNDVEKLAVLCNVKFSEFERFKQVFEQVLNKKFEQKEDNRISNAKTDKILKARDNFKNKRSDAGKMSYVMRFFELNYTEEFKNTSVKTFVKENFDLSIDTKNEQMLKQVFEQLFELYINRNRIKNKDINEDENNEKPKKFNFKKSLINYGFEEKLVNDWLIVRKEKKASNTETAFNKFINEIERKNCDINEMLRICVERSWSGFNQDWVSTLNKNKIDSETIVAGRQTMETIKKNLDASNLYVPGLEN